MISRCASLSVVLTLTAAQTWAQTRYTFTTFTVPNSLSTAATAISDDGDVVGFYNLGPPYSYTGFLRSAPGAITALSYPGSTDTDTGGINKFGLIAGSYTASSNLGGFFYYQGAYQNVVVNGYPASLSDVSDYGDYVGRYGDTGTAFVASPSGQVTILQVPGSYAAYSTSPVWIKNSGEVIGRYQDRAGYFRTFVWNANSGYRTVFVPGVPGAQVADINSSGTMVGTYVNGATSLGFVYRNGRFEIVQPPGASDSWIAAINDKGQIAGYCMMAGESPGFVATPLR